MGAQFNPRLPAPHTLRIAISRAQVANERFKAITRPDAPNVTEIRFGELEDAYLTSIADVRDALGELGLMPADIRALGEIL